jgi:hypothetical protein
MCFVLCIIARLCNSRSLVPIERFSQYFALYLVLIEHNVWRRERLLLNTAIFQLYYGQNKLFFNEIMMMRSALYKTAYYWIHWIFNSILTKHNLIEWFKWPERVNKYQLKWTFSGYKVALVLHKITVIVTFNSPSWNRPNLNNF